MNRPGFIYFLLFMLAALCSIPFLRLIGKKNQDVFEPVYVTTAYFILLFIVSTLYTISGGGKYIAVPLDLPTEDAVATSLIYLIACYSFFLVGYYSNFGKAIASSLPPPPGEWDSGKFKVIAPLMLCMGGISYYLLIQHFGGFDYYISHKQETLTGGGQQFFLDGVPLILQVFIVSFSLYLTKKRFFKLTFLVLLPALLIIGFLSGSKGQFMVPLMSAMIAYHYLKKKISLAAVAAVLVLFFAVTPLFNIYRGIGDYSRLQGDAQKSYLGMDVSGFMRNSMQRFQGIESMALIVRDTPDVMDYQYGKTFAYIAVAWIPRELWNDKPIISFGKIFALTYLHNWDLGEGTSAAATLPGEAYINFHFAGVLLAGLLMGVILRAYYEYLIKMHRGPPSVYLYAFSFLYMIVSWEFNIGGMIIIVLTNFMFFIVFSSLMGKRKTA